MTVDIKEALYVAENARRGMTEALTKEQLAEALVALLEGYEWLDDELEKRCVYDEAGE